jgi:outer membrane receptor protein involved in Fe transport
MLALMSPAAFSQGVAQIEEVTVTAQKRSENMQEVPVSIAVLSNQTLSELNLQNFLDYTQMLPSVTVDQSTDAGTGFTKVYMRGIATGNDGQATTSQPSVGMYLDELPITTIQGNLDVHMYDIARVEVLAGPQGTLYGGSSQAGTIRIITNKPEIEKFSGSVNLQGSILDGDDTGYLLEGFVNVPINDKMAVRLVGWALSDAGWIDNVLGSRTYRGVDDPVTCAASGVACSADDITLTNEDKVKKNYNTIDTVGGRAALRIDVNDNWTVSPTIMAQRAESKGSWGEDLSDMVSGDHAVSHIMDEFFNDEWYMVGLTIEGKIGNFDLVYSGSYMDRNDDGSFDYADYAYWYDVAYTTGFHADLNFLDSGPRTLENQFFPPGTPGVGTRNEQGYVQEVYDGYTKQSHEIHISTNPEKRIRGLLGLFWQHSYHDFTTPYRAPGLAAIMEMHGGDPFLTRDTVYMNSMDRNDRDKAVFGHVNFDITDELELTVGARYFEPSVTVKGFTGYGMGINTAGWGSAGERRCNLPQFNGQTDYKNKPCLNVDKGIHESESIYRVNIAWRPFDNGMLYATWSEGYRPGGINRAPAAGEFSSDFLTNYEIGWKSEFLDNRLQFNGAVFHERWDDFQVSFAGANSITQVDNGPSADVDGLEAEMVWLPTNNLKITAAGAYYKSELTDDYVDYNADGTIKRIKAPKGTYLPLTPEFKGNVVARYHFPLGGFDSYVQGALVYIGSSRPVLDEAAYLRTGDVEAHTLLDLAAGFRRGSYAFDLFVRNATDNDTPWYTTAQCAFSTCGAQQYAVRPRPITIAVQVTKDF